MNKYFQYKSSLKGKIATNCDSYKDYWKFDYVTVNENTNEIEIAFTAYNMKKDFTSNSPFVCREITNYLFSDNFEFGKQGYLINYFFICENISVFHVENIYPGMKGLAVRFRTNDAQLKDVAQWYPEAEKLTITGDFKVEDLAEFKNLQCLKINDGITQEEKEQILSICPDVNLLDTKIKDK